MIKTEEHYKSFEYETSTYPDKFMHLCIKLPRDIELHLNFIGDSILSTFIVTTLVYVNALFSLGCSSEHNCTQY